MNRLSLLPGVEAGQGGIVRIVLHYVSGFLITFNGARYIT